MMAAHMAVRTIPADDELAAFIRNYGLGAVRSTRGIEAGTVNSSFALELGQGAFFLRLYEEQGLKGAEDEALLLGHLAAKGVATPPPLKGEDGRVVRTLAGKPAALFPWVDGHILCQKTVSPDAAHEVGKALARVHAVGPNPAAPLGTGRFGPEDLVLRCERVAQSTDTAARALSGALIEAVREVATRRSAKVPVGLVHGDLFRDNVLWHEQRITALLDFESAHRGPFVFDLAVTILAWSFGDTLSAEIARAMTDGYRSERELSELERDAIFDEAIFAALRFTITRITDDAIRVGKRWQRFVERREAIERLGRGGFRAMLGV